jgi:ribose transport system substrate-binding protein
MADDNYTPKRHVMPDGSEVFEVDCSKLSKAALMNRREMLAAGALGVGAFLFAACGGGSDDTGTTSAAGGTTTDAGTSAATTSDAAIGEGQTIALSLNGFNVYCQQLATGVLEALAGTSYTFLGTQANFDAKTEISNIDNLIVQKPAALLIQPNVAEGANAGARKATAAGIPTFNMLWPDPTGDSPDYIAAVRVDGIAGGKIIADYLGGTAGLTGKILVVTGVPGQGFSEEILTGLEQGLEAYPGLTIADVQPGFFQAGPAQEAVQTMLTAHPDAVAIADFAAEMGVGIAQFMKARNIELPHITSDGNTDMISWLQEGTYLSACRYYSSADQGMVGAKIARDYLETGTTPPDFITLIEQLLSLPDSIDADVARLPLIYEQYMPEVEKIA